MMHLFLAAQDSDADLKQELTAKFPGSTPEPVHPALLHANSALDLSRHLPQLPFAQQFLPNARSVQNESIRAWAETLALSITEGVPENQPWGLHVEPHYGTAGGHHIGARAWHSAKQGRPQNPPPAKAVEKFVHRDAGRNRCELIRSATLDLLKKRRRHLLKTLLPGPATEQFTLVQLLLTTPDQGYLSVAQAPLPFTQIHLISTFPKGYIEPASDHLAPSRAFAKVIEAELRLGHSIAKGESCVDLGAAPGSWTYVAVSRGARVFAIDRAPLREDLMANPLVDYIRHDAFDFRPKETVDWLLCDVIAEAQFSADMLLHWLSKGFCRNFIVTLKLKGGPNLDLLTRLEPQLDELCSTWIMKKLCANKKELTVFGTAAM